MTIESNCRDSKKSHSRREKKISQEDDRELLELEKYISCFEKQMQVAEEGNQRYGWVMKREVRWHTLHVKIQQKMFVELKKELREVESEMEISYSEPEQGPLLGDDDEVEKERLIESLMDSIKSTYQLMEEMSVRSNETKRSYVF